MARPYQLKAVADQAPRNLIINGNFDLWARGTSKSITTSREYLADRFCHYVGTGHNAATASRSTSVPTLTQSGFQSNYSLLITAGTGATTSDVGALEYRVEGNDYASIHGRQVRLQFWVQSSLTGTHAVSFANSANDRSYVTAYSISAANTWELKTIDVKMDSSGTWLFDNTIGLKVRFPLGTASGFRTATLGSWQAGNYYSTSGAAELLATTGATFRLSQVQLVRGNFSGTELPFNRAGRTFQEELAMCQRYCWVDGAEDSANGVSHMFGLGKGISGTQGEIWVSYPMQMRAAPSMTLNGSAGTYQLINAADSSNPVCTAVTLNSAAPRQALILATVASGLAAGNMTALSRANGNTTATIAWDAEL
jgi:hypothetical protein